MKSRVAFLGHETRDRAPFAPLHSRAPGSNNQDLSYGFGEGEAFGEAAGEGADVFAFPIGPSFTILASSVPSVFFQYEPLASSFSVMSLVFSAAGGAAGVWFGVRLTEY